MDRYPHLLISKPTELNGFSDGPTRNVFDNNNQHHPLLSSSLFVRTIFTNSWANTIWNVQSCCLFFPPGSLQLVVRGKGKQAMIIPNASFIGWISVICSDEWKINNYVICQVSSPSPANLLARIPIFISCSCSNWKVVFRNLQVKLFDPWTDSKQSMFIYRPGWLGLGLGLAVNKVPQCSAWATGSGFDRVQLSYLLLDSWRWWRWWAIMLSRFLPACLPGEAS